MRQAGCMSMRGDASVVGCMPMGDSMPRSRTISVGSISSMGRGLQSGGGMLSDRMPEEINIVDRLKELQRTDPCGKVAWGDYCDEHGGGIRDPAKHDATFVLKFLGERQSELASGQRDLPQDPSAACKDISSGSKERSRDNTALISLMKEGQRRSQHWKVAWSGYCQMYGGGVNDPAKHKGHFLTSFLDFLGEQGTMGPDGSLMPFPGMVSGDGCWGERPAKRHRGDAGWANQAYCHALWAGGASHGRFAGPGGGDPTKDALVVRIKAYQRQADANREEWQNFCDELHGGVRDPARHSVEILERFVAQSGMP